MYFEKKTEKYFQTGIFRYIYFVFKITVIFYQKVCKKMVYETLNVFLFNLKQLHYDLLKMGGKKKLKLHDLVLR